MRLYVGQDIAALYDILVDFRQLLLDRSTSSALKAVFRHHLAPERASGPQVFAMSRFGIHKYTESGSICGAETGGIFNRL